MFFCSKLNFTHQLSLAVGLISLMANPEPLRRPDVQIQTVLAQVRVGVPHLLPFEAGEVFVLLLIATVRKLGGVDEVVRPATDRDGFFEPGIKNRAHPS